MPQTLRPYAVHPVPTTEDIAAVASVLDEPGDVLLPYLPGPEGDRILAAARCDDNLPPVDPSADAPLVLAVATTGSTGTPKIVLHTGRSLRASIDATAEATGGHGQWLLCLGINHIAGIQVVLRSAVAGTELVTSSVGGPRFAEDFAQAAARLTGPRRYVSMVPTQLQRLTTAAAGFETLRSFDAILLGGAAAEPDLLERVRAEGLRVVTTYGMSETAGGCVYDGVPLPGVEIGIADGVISLTGEVVAAGYRDRIEPYPFSGHTFTTSDLGEMRDGRLQILGRADDIINTGGKKVSPLRVEQALRALPTIADAIVVGVPDAQWGQRIVAVVTGPDAATDPDGATEPIGATEPALEPALELRAVREALRGRLAAHELPTDLVRVPALPVKGIGKADRAAALRLARLRLASRP